MRRSTKKEVIRSIASSHNNKVFSMPTGEGSEADRSEGHSKRQKKEKERRRRG